MSLSKDWTLERARGVLRILADEISENKIQTLQLDDIIHLNVLDLAELLGEAKIPEYGKISVVTQTSDIIDISALRVDRIRKLVDATNGLVVDVDEISFEGLAAIPQKQNNVYFYWFGSDLLLYKGSGTSTYGALNLYYDRVPDKATADSDYIDVSDKFMKLLIDKAKIMIYEDLRMTPPEALSGSVNEKVKAIRAANQSERSTKDKKLN